MAAVITQGQKIGSNYIKIGDAEIILQPAVEQVKTIALSFLLPEKVQNNIRAGSRLNYLDYFLILAWIAAETLIPECYNFVICIADSLKITYSLLYIRNVEFVLQPAVEHKNSSAVVLLFPEEF